MRRRLAINSISRYCRTRGTMTHNYVLVEAEGTSPPALFEGTAGHILPASHMKAPKERANPLGEVQDLTHRRHRGATYRGGAQRADRKPRFDLIPFEFLESVAETLSSGAVRYGSYNWKRGHKDFFIDTWNHAFVHLQKFKEGDASEDHLAHLACNVAFLVWAVQNGVVTQEDFSNPV